MAEKKQKVKHPIGVRLILIFSLLTIAVLGIATYTLSTLVRSDEQNKAEDYNLTINNRTAESVQYEFLNEQINATGFLNTINVLPERRYEQLEDSLFNDYCKRNEEVVFICSEKTKIKCNEADLKMHSDLPVKIQKWLDANSKLKELTLSEGAQVVNISSIMNTPMLGILFKYSVNEKTEAAFVGFKTTKLNELMSTGKLNTSFLLSKDGVVLIHSDYDKVMAAENLSYLEAVKNFMSSEDSGHQTKYPDENGNNWFYAYSKIIGGMFVITSISEADVFDAINRTTYRIILFTIAIIFLSIIVIRFFSKTITYPIRSLVDAAHEIEKGNYSLSLKPKKQDEVGLLTTSFNEMAKGLTERERLKTTFSKFTNKAIAEKAMRGEMQLGGETREATIFFSDIRSFTAMSEKLAPQEVVDFLNQYMTKMVDCVNKTNGVVDKYIGDAIMAVWGAPESSGTPADDAWNSVKAALMMRYSLLEHNKIRASEGKPPIKIGCGINSGPVVAGQIGSVDRMEYTVIGDAVNFASRTESLNKPFATDILITENTWKLIKDKIVYEEMPSVHVKGKEAAVRMFAVINEKTSETGPKNIDELRKLLGVQTPDLAKVNTDEEEKKYKING